MPTSSLSDKRINHYFSLAKNASKFSDFDKQHLGAVIIYKGRVLSVGWNSTKTAPIQKSYNRLRGYDVETAKNSLHAECSALIKCKDMDIDWGRASVFVYRELKDGSKAKSAPCPACRQMIKDMGIKNIYYTVADGTAHERID